MDDMDQFIRDLTVMADRGNYFGIAIEIACQMKRCADALEKIEERTSADG